MKNVILSCALAIFLVIGNSITAEAQIVTGSSVSDVEKYAAKELQRYMYQLTGEWFEIIPDSLSSSSPEFIVGQVSSNSIVEEMEAEGIIELDNTAPAGQGYTLKTIKSGGNSTLVIAGEGKTGVLYGVYGLLEDHYGIGFYFSGDVLPDRKQQFSLPVVNEQKNPEMEIRGVLPWTNFPQSATSYSWKDWKYIIDQTAKMRMNFILVHNYNGELGHNEPFHNFEYRGYMSRVWMPTAKTGHSWSSPGWDVNEYRFGAADFFDDYDFGSEIALHNKNLSNRQVFRKGVSLFQKVIQYAHTRGVKIGLGLDINMIPDDYDAKADDPEVIQARADQIVSDYPGLDYLFCFQSENVGKNPEFFETWKGIFDGFYEEIKKRSPGTRLAVSGWGLDPESIESLPDDVIAAPIAPYSADFESGSVYGDREYWGCPWLERDFNSSQYYYPYNMDLSETINSYRNRASNMNGFFTLTWRLTDAVEPRMWYVSKAPWNEELNSAQRVYKKYSKMNYGEHAAEEITNIINGNEPFACDFGECEPTREFSLEASYNKPLMNITSFQFIDEHKDKGKNFEAASYSQQKGIVTGEDKEWVQDIHSGDWLLFEDIGFSDKWTGLQAEVASANKGGIIQVRLDSPEGEIIGELEINSTNGWKKWTTVDTRIKKVQGTHDVYLKFVPWQTADNDLSKAKRQLETIDSLINQTSSISNRYRLNLLRSRIAAVRDHIILNRDFQDYTWEDFPGVMDSWTQNFMNRVTDISTLGNIVSTQNRFVKSNYIDKVNSLREEQMVKAPSNIRARGSRNGAVIKWNNEEPNAASYNIYRDGEKIGNVPYTQTIFRDSYHGEAEYSVSAVNTAGEESVESIPDICYAGEADDKAPQINVISPPVSHPYGQPLTMKVSILDNRDYDELSLKFYYRKPEETSWSVLVMSRKVKSTFTLELPGELITDKGLEYYFKASDGTNQSFFPKTAPNSNLSLITYSTPDSTAPSTPAEVTVTGNLIQWNKIEGGAFRYKIYRSRSEVFQPGPDNLVTHVSENTHSYKDNKKYFDGSTLTGRWYYRVTAVDVFGNESPPSQVIPVNYVSD